MNEEDLKMLEDLVSDFCRRSQLYGCDAVQVLLSSHDGASQDTRILKDGRGNWYARKGLAQEFIDEDHARTENYIRVNEFPEDDV